MSTERQSWEIVDSRHGVPVTGSVLLAVRRGQDEGTYLCRSFYVREDGTEVNRHVLVTNLMSEQMEDIDGKGAILIEVGRLSYLTFQREGLQAIARIHAIFSKVIPAEVAEVLRTGINVAFGGNLLRAPMYIEARPGEGLDDYTVLTVAYNGSSESRCVVNVHLYGAMAVNAGMLSTGQSVAVIGQSVVGVSERDGEGGKEYFTNIDVYRPHTLTYLNSSAMRTGAQGQGYEAQGGYGDPDDIPV